MARVVLLGLFLFLAPEAQALEIWDDGGHHVVDVVIGGISFARDSTGGAPTTVSLVAGADVFIVEVEDSSVFRVFPGAQILEINYHDSSSGLICGGELRNVDMRAGSSADVEINGGTFTNVGAVVRVFGASSVVIQGGSFETTGQTNAITVSTGAPLEFRGGTIVDGNLAVVGTAVISGGNFGSNEIVATGGGVVTVVGTSFNLCPVLPCQLKGNTVGVFDEILIGTLADGSPINTRLAGFNLATLLFLEEGTQAPLTSACEQLLPRSVPALPLVGGALLALVLLLVVAGLAVRARA